MALATTLAIITPPKAALTPVVSLSSSSARQHGENGAVLRRNLLVGIGVASSGLASLKKVSSFAHEVAAAAEPSLIKLVDGVTQFPARLESTIRVEIRRPAISRTREEKEEYEEVLVIDGIEFDGSKFVKFDVFVNDDDDGVRRRPDSAEFAGSFVNAERRSGKTAAMRRRTTLRLGLTDLLEDLDADGEESVTVSLVPRTGCDDVVVSGVRIELLGD